MEATKYLALLRGINVGGKNIMKMADLKTCFEEMPFSNVATYIQIGNVLFQSAERDKQKLEQRIQKSLWKAFTYTSVVIVVPHRQLRQIVERAPQGFGSQPDQYKYDLAFLKEPLTPAEVLEQFNLKEEVDQAYAGKLAFYFSRLTSRAAQSRLNRIHLAPHLSADDHPQLEFDHEIVRTHGRKMKTQYFMSATSNIQRWTH